MASSDFWQKLSISLGSSAEWEAGATTGYARGARGTVKLWMVADVVTVWVAAVLATLYKLHTSPVAGAKGFWHGTLIHGRSMWILLALLCGFTIVLIVTSRRLHLYTPTHMTMSTIVNPHNRAKESTWNGRESMCRAHLGAPPPGWCATCKA